MFVSLNSALWSGRVRFLSRLFAITAGLRPLEEEDRSVPAPSQTQAGCATKEQSRTRPEGLRVKVQNVVSAKGRDVPRQAKGRDVPRQLSLICIHPRLSAVDLSSLPSRRFGLVVGS